MSGKQSTNETKNPAEKLVSLCVRKGFTVSAAESCTGGMVAQMITSVSGASDCFSESFVTYSNESKMTRLGVRKETLEAHGAVSRETAAEMAEGVRKTAGAHVAVGITGIAGPTGGTPEKPVGLVYFGFAFGENVLTEKKVFPGSRNEVRRLAADYAIRQMTKIIEGGTDHEKD